MMNQGKDKTKSSSSSSSKDKGGVSQCDHVILSIVYRDSNMEVCCCGGGKFPSGVVERSLDVGYLVWRAPVFKSYVITD